MATFLSFLSFFGILIGLVSLAYPLRFMYIHDRRTAAIVLAASVVTFLPAAVIDGGQRQDRARAEQAASVPPPVATPPKSPAERAEEECNKVSGAIPDCKEVLTKQIAEEMAHPKAPPPAAVEKVSAAVEKVAPGKPWRQWSEDEMTEFMRRGLIICIKKDRPAQHDCYAEINTIADDWKAHHG
jgi:hypothetical protein